MHTYLKFIISITDTLLFFSVTIICVYRGAHLSDAGDQVDPEQEDHGDERRCGHERCAGDIIPPGGRPSLPDRGERVQTADERVRGDRGERVQCFRPITGVCTGALDGVGENT